MDLTARFHVPEMVGHQTLDGEVVMINYAEGVYYSLRGTASAIWALLIESHSVQRIIEYFRNHYEGDARAIEEGVVQLVERLASERLILPADAVSPPVGRTDPGLMLSSRLPFTQPLFERFADLSYYKIMS